MLISELRNYSRRPLSEMEEREKTLFRSNTEAKINTGIRRSKRLVTTTAQQIDSYNKKCPKRTKSMFEKLKAAYAQFKLNTIKNTESRNLLKVLSSLQDQLEALKSRARVQKELRFNIQREHNQLMCSLKYLVDKIK